MKAELTMSSRRAQEREQLLWNNPNPATPIEKARSVVGDIVRVLQKEKFVKEVGIEVSEVFKGGSLGQGTAVPHHYDIDLVLYSEDITAEDLIKEEDSSDEESEGSEEGEDDYLTRIDEYLEEELGDRYTYEDTTDVAIKFNYKNPLYGVSLDVDLLLSPFFKEQEDLLKFLRDIHPAHNRRLFSAGASKWQTKFIKQQHNWVKEFCRRAKAWRNKAWQGIKEGRPKSYLMCLLVIVAYNRVPQHMKTAMRSFAPRMTEEFKKLVKQIESTPDLELVKEKNSIFKSADRSLKESYKDLLDKPPRIIDPANPSNNLYKSGISKTPGGNKWASFAAKVNSLDLGKPTDRIMAGL